MFSQASGIVTKLYCTYILVFNSSDSVNPEEDHYQATLDIAMRVCEEDYGISRTDWNPIDASEVEY